MNVEETEAALVLLAASIQFQGLPNDEVDEGDEDRTIKKCFALAKKFVEHSKPPCHDCTEPFHKNNCKSCSKTICVISDIGDFKHSTKEHANACATCQGLLCEDCLQIHRARHARDMCCHNGHPMLNAGGPCHICSVGEVAP